jgi:hypothetical protein
MDDAGHVVLRKRLARSELPRFIANLPPLRIGMEACGSAHYWAQRFREHGHDVRLIAPHFVKAYVKSPKDVRTGARWAFGPVLSRGVLARPQPRRRARQGEMEQSFADALHGQPRLCHLAEREDLGSAEIPQAPARPSARHRARRPATSDSSTLWNWKVVGSGITKGTRAAFDRSVSTNAWNWVARWIECGTPDASMIRSASRFRR